MLIVINYYSKRIKATEKKLSKEKKGGVEYHEQYYQVQKEKAELLFRSNELGKEDNYDVLQFHIDVKYILEKLQYHLAKITLQNRYPNKLFDFRPYQACEALINLPQYQKNPLIKLYLLNIDLVKKSDDSTYNFLFNALQQYQQIIPASFLKPFYTNLNNYCAFQIAKGKFDFYKKLITTYDVMHNYKLLTNNNIIDIAILKNIVTVACRAKEFDWANKMLNENIDHVSDEIQESVFNYNKGIIAFNKGNYSVAQDYFLQVGKIDEFHSTNLKATLLQCFYEFEQHYSDYTQQMIDSFRVFLTTTKKLSVPQNSSYKNFIKAFDKLYGFRKIINKQEKCLKIKSKLPALIDFINNEQYVWNREWLLVKAQALKNDCEKYY